MFYFVYEISVLSLLTAPTNFVSSFAAEDNYVYFLFGETAVEERSVVCIKYAKPCTIFFRSLFLCI